MWHAEGISLARRPVAIRSNAIGRNSAMSLVSKPPLNYHGNVNQSYASNDPNNLVLMGLFANQNIIISSDARKCSL
jgi:hypothetical protein